MKWIKAFLVAAAALAAAGSAQAAGVGVRAGTTGVGGDVGFRLMPTLSARLGYSGLSYSRDVDVTDVEYDGRLRLSNLNLLLDFSPLPGPFRITGGFIFNDNKIDVTGRPTGGTYTLNGKSTRPPRSAACPGPSSPATARRPTWASATATSPASASTSTSTSA